MQPFARACGSRFAVDGLFHRLGTSPHAVQRLSEAFPYIELEKGANEVRLLHGTKSSSVAKIIREGFDDRLNEHIFYGIGIYFSTEPCNIKQHCGKEPLGVHFRVIEGAEAILGEHAQTSHGGGAVDEVIGGEYDGCRVGGSAMDAMDTNMDAMDASMDALVLALVTAKY